MPIRTHLTDDRAADDRAPADDDEVTPIGGATEEDAWDPTPAERAELDAAIADADADQGEPVPSDEVLAHLDRILAAYQ